MSEADSQPTITGAIIFQAKTVLLQLNRAFRNRFVDKSERFTKGETLADESIIAESRTPVWANTRGAEWQLEAGKIHNLRIALRKINGLEIPAGRLFSFWAHVGRPLRLRGYARGRELREGCVIPSVGGGLCQLSNALYDAALKARFDIIERHAHTQVVPGSLAEAGRDATIFWNYVDLRFKSKEAFRIEASLTSDHLIVRFKSKTPARALQVISRTARSKQPNSCASCGVEDCFRNIERDARSRERAAFLVDEYWPEFDSYIQTQRSERDYLGLPIDGKRFNKANYRWNTSGFEKTREHRFATLLRAYESRRLAPQGASRQRVILKHDERLAMSFASLLTYEITHVTVMQNLLPFLWREGFLGGRTFDVLMTRLPIDHLEETLDFAHRLHPESRTLSDFRAELWLARAEREALANAQKIITPHTAIARLFPEKSVLLDWAIPSAKRRPASGDKVIFPASTLGRKGAYELRDVARSLDLEVVAVGAELEEKNFWRGVKVEHRSYAEGWLDGAAAVVLPSFVENKPRRLLEAAACRVPVIASSACGLENVDGIVTIPPGDAQALYDAVRNALIESEQGLLAAV
jgi:glycosyltransferase involved in cell wall biosynthesis